MNGRGSLGMRQKSFRILLKSDPLGSDGVGENLNTLNYDLFGEYANRTPDGERVTWYRHILLRNGGGDNSGCTISRSHIGDAYIQRIDRFLKPDDMAYAPVMTFVNGEFWGCSMPATGWIPSISPASTAWRSRIFRCWSARTR